MCDTDEKLSEKHKSFIDIYLTNGLNAPKAYQAVYPNASKESANTHSQKLLKNVQKTSYFVKKSQEKSEKSQNSYKKNLERLQKLYEISLAGDPIFDKNGNEIGRKKLVGHAVQVINEINKMEGNHAETKIKLMGTGNNGEIEVKNIEVKFTD
jgi:hypothetical protein